MTTQLVLTTSTIYIESRIKCPPQPYRYIISQIDMCACAGAHRFDSFASKHTIHGVVSCCENSVASLVFNIYTVRQNKNKTPYSCRKLCEKLIDFQDSSLIEFSTKYSPPYLTDVAALP